MRPEVVSLLRSSEQSFMHHLVASSPQALFRWGVLRATIRILTVFKIMVRQRAELCRLLKCLIGMHFFWKTIQSSLVYLYCSVLASLVYETSFDN